jgi:protoporphyrinogen/coproporphyrinogen III oxidase
MPAARSAPHQVAIIGGGITGLAAAYTLQERSRSLGIPLTAHIFETSTRLGGKLLTEHDAGFTIEGGPDSFLAQKPWATELALALGLGNELIGTNPDQKQLYVIHKGKPVRMPEGIALIIPTRLLPFLASPLISWPGKLRMGLDLVLPPRKDGGDESIASLVRRRLGNEALEMLAEPLLSGIHVSDPEQQSLLSTFPRYRALEEQHSSLIRGTLAQQRAARARAAAAPKTEPGTWRSSAFVSLCEGMAQLVTALEKALTGCTIHTNCAVAEIRPQAKSGYQLKTADGSSWNMDAVVAAAPAYVTAELSARFAPHLARSLKAIRYVSTATVSLAYHQSEFGDALRGVGFLVPRKENRRVSACTINSVKFANRAPQDALLLRCFIGGPGREEALESSDAGIIAEVRAELAALLGLRAEPLLARVYRWNRGNPQYDVGHLERVKELHKICPSGLFLAGSAYEGVGIPDCIHQGQLAAEKALAYLSS